MPRRFSRPDNPRSNNTRAATALPPLSLGVVTVAFGHPSPDVSLQHEFVRHVMPEAPYVVVVDSDEAAATINAAVDDSHMRVVVAQSPHAQTLSTARGRNIGARALFDEGAHFALFLHPRSVPLPGLVEAYRGALSWGGPYGSWIFNGPVTYLSERDDLRTMSALRAARLRDPAPNRVFPPVGDVMSNDDHHLFMADNFVMSHKDWKALGGFCEDIFSEREQESDFAQRSRALGVSMAWVGGAHALRSAPSSHRSQVA